MIFTHLIDACTDVDVLYSCRPFVFARIFRTPVAIDDVLQLTQSARTSIAHLVFSIACVSFPARKCIVRPPRHSSARNVTKESETFGLSKQCDDPNDRISVILAVVKIGAIQIMISEFLKCGFVSREARFLRRREAAGGKRKGVVVPRLIVAVRQLRWWFRFSDRSTE